MKLTKSSWFVAGVVAGAVVIAGIVLVINDWDLSPKATQGESRGHVRRQINHQTLKVLNEANRLFERVNTQFASASEDAEASALASDLQTLRSQIELYKIQHLEKLPSANIVNQLTMKTNISGEVEGASGATGPFSYGPYLCKIPTNPFTKKNAVETGTGRGGGGNAGWYYNTQTGKLSPDSDEHKDY